MNLQFYRKHSAAIFNNLLLWLLLSLIIGVFAGSASALFLWSLDMATRTRAEHPWLLYLLPWGGVLVAAMYSRYGKNTDAGNNLLIDEIHNPQKIVPIRMAPFVFIGTLLTHLLGGSAGREGTAVQMGGTLADQLTSLFKLDSEKRKILLMAGISAGFSSVFGTPLAGTLFGMEVLSVGRLRSQALLPCLLSALIAHFVCLSWGIHHSTFTISQYPDLNLMTLIHVALAGICFGLCAKGFSWSSHKMTKIFKTILKSPTSRAFVGGLLIILAAAILQSDRYLGLGIPVISESFQQTVPTYDFIFKLLFTVITLSSGFKGGEVTPLFFIGATLGNALAWILPLPLGFLSGLGFVAVFAGAANTPISCILLALEIFGTDVGIYAALVCVISYFFSGDRGIYHSQRIEVSKHA